MKARMIIDHSRTRDECIPFEDGGWRSTPAPPDDDGRDGTWVLYDARSDRFSRWRRIRLEIAP
jgi:hypothetical protein